MAPEHPAHERVAHPGPAAEEESGQVKITVGIGKDTLNRLDKIVEHGGFGGRGRALDSLLEALDDIVDNIRVFSKNVNQMGKDEEANNEAWRGAIFAAILAFTKIERFYGLKGGVSPPPGSLNHGPRGPPPGVVFK